MMRVQAKQIGELYFFRKSEAKNASYQPWSFVIFGKQHDFLPKKLFFAKNVLLCSGSVELKTDSKSARWLRFYN